MEMKPKTVPGQGEEDCMYPISPQLLPHGRPYTQPFPLTRTQLYAITKPLESIPVMYDLINKWKIDPNKFSTFQNINFDSVPTEPVFPHGLSSTSFKALPGYTMTMKGTLLQLHLQNQKLQSQIYHLRQSTLSR